jgi:hypothetical protein
MFDTIVFIILFVTASYYLFKIIAGIIISVCDFIRSIFS